MNKVICKFASVAAAEKCWFQTTPPYGEYNVGGITTGADGKPLDKATLVFDEKSVAKVVEAFRSFMAEGRWPGVLVDREHFSLDRGKTSDAMAWAKDIRVADDGSIWTKWDFTSEGEAVWNGHVLVSRSPVLAIEPVKGRKDVFTPVKLESIAMTNSPHFKELSTLAAACAAEVNNNEGEIPMNKIMEALGLAEGASEDEALAAINALKERASAAEVKATDAEKAVEDAEKERDDAQAECRGLKADAFIAAHKDRIADVAACREAYMKDPATAEKLVAAFKAPGAKSQQVLAAAKTAPGKPSTLETGLAACKSAEERVAYVTAHAAEFAAETK